MGIRYPVCPCFCMYRGRFTASPQRAATVPVLAAVRQAKRTKERLAAGLQQNRFSVVRLRLCGVSRDKLITDHAGGGLSIVADFKTEKAHSEKRLWVYDIRSKLGQDALCGSERVLSARLRNSGGTAWFRSSSPAPP